MIAPSKVKEEKNPLRWHWFTKSLLFNSCTDDIRVICKPEGFRFWWVRRFCECRPNDIVARAKTERSIEARFGDIPASALVSMKKTARFNSDVRKFGFITGSDNILIRDKESGEWKNVQFMDCKCDDFALMRVVAKPRWEFGSFGDCEYSDFVACLDFTILKKLVKWLAVTMAIAGLIGWIVYFACRERDETKIESTPAKKTQIAEYSPITNKQIQARQPVKPKHTPLGYENGVEILAQSVRTNNSGAVIEKLKLADGTSKTKVRPKPPLFENPCDQVIAMALSTKPGDSMPPLPDLTGIDQDFVNSLLSPIVIKEDDSDEVKNIKEMVIEVRKTLAEEVKNGGSVMDVLRAHQAEMNSIYERRLDAILMMQQVSAEQGLGAAQEFADAVNKRFEKEGIPAIPVVGRGKNQHRTNSR